MNRIYRIGVLSTDYSDCADIPGRRKDFEKLSPTPEITAIRVICG
jgi:hypothetical protein